jgi:hypothetical protein
MIRIKFPQELPQEIQQWKDRAEEITIEIIAAQDIEDKRSLIDRYEAHWRAPVLISWLSSLSHDKCWYTDTKFGGDYQELEHFRPKKSTKDKLGNAIPNHEGYYWLAFDLDNYRLCKRRPNAKKGTFFPIIDERFRAIDPNHDWRDELPLFLDPKDEEDYLFLSFDDNGRPVPSIEIEAQDVERVNFTIEKYFLDEEVLNRRRRETWLTCRQLYNKYMNTMKKVKSTPNDQVRLRAEAKKDLELLKSLLDPKQEFCAVAKQSLLKTGHQHAINIAMSV